MRVRIRTPRTRRGALLLWPARSRTPRIEPATDPAISLANVHGQGPPQCTVDGSEGCVAVLVAMPVPSHGSDVQMRDLVLGTACVRCASQDEDRDKDPSGVSAGGHDIPLRA